MAILSIADFLAAQAARRESVSDPDTEQPQRIPSDSSSRASSGAPEEPSTDTLSEDAPANSASSSPRGRKRPAGQDLNILASRAAQRVRLDEDNVSALCRWANQASDIERELALMAQVLALQQHLNHIQPAAAKFILPPELREKIDSYAPDVLQCPELTAYSKLPTSIVLNLLERNPLSGYTMDVRSTASKNDIVVDRVQTRLTDRHSEIKAVIRRSIGKIDPNDPSRRRGSSDIVTLVEAVNAKLHAGKAKVALHIDSSIRTTVAMCARFAFLRSIYCDDPSAKYWQSVDDALEQVRNDLAAQPKQMVSLYFQQILTQDMEQYGQVDLDALLNVRRSLRQKRIDNAATGIDLDDSDDNA